MRVIFLDIDGVLNHPGTWAAGAPWRQQGNALLRVPVEPACVARLNRLAETAEAKIVISSSWRLYARWRDLGPALARHGLECEVIGETPNLVNDQAWLDAWRARTGGPFLYDRLERGWEIAEWLRRREDVSSFVILDDCDDMSDLRHRLVLTDPVFGIDDPDVDRALVLFGLQPA